MSFKNITFEELAQYIQQARSFILTTHKNSDADGLGSIIAFHHLLKNKQLKVQSIVVDDIHQRYDFMEHQNLVEVHSPSTQINPADLAIVFDTNDPRLIEPLYSDLKKKAKTIIFVDHHCPLESISDQHQLYLDTQAASTGEICYALIEKLNEPITPEIAQAIYISIIFDTHMFRSTKNLSQAFFTCSQLLKHIKTNNTYENLFCQYDQNTWNQMLKVLKNISYNSTNQIALIELNHLEFKSSKLKIFHLLDFLDLVMKRNSILIGILSVEKTPGVFKLSFRSKSNIDVSKLAESFGGGGHAQSAGATVQQYSSKHIIQKIEPLLSKKVA